MSNGLEMQDHEVESCSYSIEKKSVRSRRSQKKDDDAKSHVSKSSFTKSLENIRNKQKGSVTGSSQLSRPRRPRVKWTEADYDKFVKIVRRHGKDWRKL